MTIPGLIERRLISKPTPTTVEIEEIWNVAAEGCPIIVVDLKSGEINKSAVTVRRRLLMSNFEWNYGV